MLDMNGDGMPEIVVHSRESDSYADEVYTMDSLGRVTRVTSRGGGYA